MSTNLRNTAPYLRVQRLFPSDNPQALAVEIDRAYIDIASAINARTIGVFSVNVQSINGESWFLQGGNRRQQGLRQIYQFTAAGTIPHYLNFDSISTFTKIYGTFYDGTVYYPLPYVDVTSVTNQISITVDATNINITAGGGSPPAIVSGIVVLEWISQV